MTCKAYIACALLLTLPGSQLSAADEKSITYYLPQSVIVAKFQVRKKVWHPAPYADVTPHFFPMAKEADLSKNEEDIPPNVFIKTSKSRYSLESPSISVSGVPDPNRLISVTSKGVLKDISTTLAFDDEGLLTTLKYTQKDRKWDFLLRILTTAAKVAAGVAGFPASFSTFANTPAEDRNKLLAGGPAPSGAPSALAKECPYFDEMTIAEREVLWSNELRPMLKMPYCLLPPEFRRPLRDLNAANGSGIAAFASYFAAELKDACAKFPCSATPNPFRPQPGSATPHRIRIFFEVWQLVDELEKIQSAHLASLSDYSNLPASGESYRITLGERDKRLEFIGEQLFGTTTTSNYWSGEFRITRPDKIPDAKSSVILFRFSAEPKDGPAVLKPKPSPGQAAIDAANVRSMAPWPALTANVAEKDYTEITLLPKALFTPEGSQCVVTEDDYVSRIPVSYELQLSNAATTLLIQDVRMSQGGPCKLHPAKNGALDLSLDPRTGEARSIAITRNSALTPELAGQLDGLAGVITGAIATSRANAEKAPERELQQQVLESLAAACKKDPLNSNCVAFINKK